MQRHICIVQHIVLNDVVNTCLFLRNDINSLLCEVVVTSSLSTIWENTDGCAEQYRCAFALYLMSVMSQTYSIIIDRGISESRHGK